jgi:hypothetical protein
MLEPGPARIEAEGSAPPSRAPPPNPELHRTKPAVSPHRRASSGGMLMVESDLAPAGFAGEFEAIGRAE